mmetsp:Transcript_6113/g.23764  ORF Transcript_6113/g.23764 Transcript_6113/m.23764 type:complete len:275 (+) Transcript_6113:3247-4071(+)
MLHRICEDRLRVLWGVKARRLEPDVFRFRALLAAFPDLLPRLRNLPGVLFHTRGGYPARSMPGVRRGDALQKQLRLLDVPDLCVGAQGHAVQVGEISLGVHDGLARHRVGHLVQAERHHLATRFGEAAQDACDAVGGVDLVDHLPLGRRLPQHLIRDGCEDLRPPLLRSLLGMVSRFGQAVPIVVGHRGQLPLQIRKLVADLRFLLADFLHLFQAPLLPSSLAPLVHMLVYRFPHLVRLRVVLVIRRVAAKQRAAVATELVVVALVQVLPELPL